MATLQVLTPEEIVQQHKPNWKILKKNGFMQDSLESSNPADDVSPDLSGLLSGFSVDVSFGETMVSDHPEEEIYGFRMVPPTHGCVSPGIKTLFVQGDDISEQG